jgi:hypothetical protein
MPDRPLEENARALTRALERVRTGAVAPAARDDPGGRFRRGEAVGFVEEQVVAWGEPGDTLRAVLSALTDRSSESPERAIASSTPELVTVLAGEDPPLGLADVETMMRGALDGELEVELRYGGQPAYWWLLAAE